MPTDTVSVLGSRASEQCGECEATYTSDEVRALGRMKAVESDTDPWNQHGFQSVCARCGKGMSRGGLRLSTGISVKGPDGGPMTVRVSTVHLLINHQFGDGPPIWYETMAFPENGSVRCDDQWRYHTRAEAEAGHAKVLRLLADGKYRVSAREWSLEVAP